MHFASFAVAAGMATLLVTTPFAADSARHVSPEALIASQMVGALSAATCGYVCDHDECQYASQHMSYEEDGGNVGVGQTAPHGCTMTHECWDDHSCGVDLQGQEDQLAWEGDLWQLERLLRLLDVQELAVLVDRHPNLLVNPSRGAIQLLSGCREEVLISANLADAVLTVLVGEA